ncbi:MAG: class I SAM-dependent methyltransferase [Spirochaetes bacterium]|nr:class I SAM-dependent methyltransferase [Spirochaetota bacterium]
MSKKNNMSNNAISKHCKICDASIEFVFDGLVLNKYNVRYFKCNYCGFLHTEEPYWLEEAYGDAITSIDVGYVQRNIIYGNLLPPILNKITNPDGKFLDYGGGYGLFVRLMRDKGYDFYRYDKYCKNIFAQYFDANDIEREIKEYEGGWGYPFEMLTCFEVFEHLSEPLREVENMLKYSNTILFSTELQPDIKLASTSDWWYFAPEAGQHIAFYTALTLKILAKKFGLNIFHLNSNLHLLTDKNINISVFDNNKPTWLQRALRRLHRCFFKHENSKERISLIEKDFLFAKSMIMNKKSK